MPARFAFRQIDHRDLDMFLRDGEIRSKNHPNPQQCHQTSYSQIVQFRGAAQFNLPYGGVVNDYVAFYLSPVTAFTYTIHRGNVEVISPVGVNLGASKKGDRIFLVTRLADVFACNLQACFSNFALNSHAPLPTVEADPNLLGTHLNWPLFDDPPFVAKIPELGYQGVCQYFASSATPSTRQHRKEARMAEFLVKNSLPTNLICGIITPNEGVQSSANLIAKRYGFGGAVLHKPNCFV